MLGSLQSQDSGSPLLNRYASQMGALAQQRRAEQALMQTRDKAEAISDRLKEVIEQTAQESDYLVDMSYRLRTLLNAIIGFSSLMEKESQGPLQDAYKGYASDIHSSDREVLSLLEGFNARDREFAANPHLGSATPGAEPKAEAPVAPAESAPPRPTIAELKESNFGVTEIIREAYAEIRQSAAQREVKIRARLSRDLPQIRGDRSLLRSMITHLTAVAIEGSTSGTEVEIIASTDEAGALRFAVDSAVHNSASVAQGMARPNWDWISEIMRHHGGSFDLEGDTSRHFLAVATLPATRTLYGVDN